ncbi:MAG: PilZ domain-containing protein [Sphingobium sp.]|nr:PilZ domain-containing protein [Sphingobium sp.]
MPAALNPKEMRRAVRQDVCYRCEMAVDSVNQISALMVNISPLGCLMRCSKDIPQGTILSFALPLVGRCEARVVWAMGGRIGMEFTKTIESHPYLAMLEHLNRPSDEMGIY